MQSTQQNLYAAVSDEAIDRVMAQYRDKTYLGSPIDIDLIPAAREFLHLFSEKSEEIRYLGSRDEGQTHPRYGDLSLSALVKSAFVPIHPNSDELNKKSSKYEWYDRSSVFSENSLILCGGPTLNEAHLQFLLVLLALSIYQGKGEVYFKLDEFAAWMSEKETDPENQKKLLERLREDLRMTLFLVRGTLNTRALSSSGSMRDKVTGEEIFFASLGPCIHRLASVDNFIFRKLKEAIGKHPAHDVLRKVPGKES